MIKAIKVKHKGCPVGIKDCGDCPYYFKPTPTAKPVPCPADRPTIMIVAPHS